MSGLAEQVYPDPKRFLRCLVPHRGEALHNSIDAFRPVARTDRISRLGGTTSPAVYHLVLINIRVEPGAQTCYPRLPGSSWSPQKPGDAGFMAWFQA